MHLVNEEKIYMLANHILFNKQLKWCSNVSFLQYIIFTKPFI